MLWTMGAHRAFPSLCARLCGAEVLYVSGPPRCREGPEAGGGLGLSESLSLDGSLGSDRSNHIAPTGPLKMFSSVGF